VDDLGQHDHLASVVTLTGRLKNLLVLLRHSFCSTGD
jgi:hypothetical protein